MTERFADTHYFVALAYPRDQYAAIAKRFRANQAMTQLVTSEFVLLEFLGFVCEAGPRTRRQAAITVRELHEAADMDVIPATSELFQAGLQLYEARPDKGYSLVDCISMAIMRERGIDGVLTADHHFEQEGFRSLLRA